MTRLVECKLREARVDDVPVLTALMREFYAESGFSLSPEAASRAFTLLLGDPDRGRIFVVEAGSEPAGYLVLSLGFSMEYGGLRAFVDDFFVRPALRGRGLGATALDALRETCREHGVRALMVETGPGDHPARRVYARAGFTESGRVLLTQRLAPPINEA